MVFRGFNVKALAYFFTKGSFEKKSRRGLQSIFSKQGTFPKILVNYLGLGIKLSFNGVLKLYRAEVYYGL
jgi:hypothetical protein